MGRRAAGRRSGWCVEPGGNWFARIGQDAGSGGEYYDAILRMGAGVGGADAELHPGRFLARWEAGHVFGIGHIEMMVILALGCVPAIGAVLAVVLLASKRQRRVAPHTMAPCPDCGHGVSLRAQTCPGCGAPLKALS